MAEIAQILKRRPSASRRLACLALSTLALCATATRAAAQTTVPPPRVGNRLDARAAAPVTPTPPETQGLVTETVEDALSPGGISATLKLLILLTVLSLAPSILLMTTCFLRFIIVFGLLRQALGTQQLPPNQVITSLTLFLTLMVMLPVWRAGYENGIRPYTHREPIATPAGSPLLPDEPDEQRLEQAAANAVQPLRDFMVAQIDETGNADAVWMLLDYQRPAEGTPEAASYVEPEDYDDVPLSVLVPAFMLSELKTAFIIGFQIYLPFIVIDMVISTVLISMGMMMLPPVLISLPFKLLLFVLIDGWTLTVGMLLEGVTQFG
jgi:flagellar biosynthetic protein FliP